MPMRPEITPVERWTRDDDRVTVLHLGLLSLIRDQGNPRGVQKILLKEIATEVRDNFYGAVTGDNVARYQYQLKHYPKLESWPKFPKDDDEIVDAVRSIPDRCPGDVDAPTAKALNWLVEAFRRIESPPPLPEELQPDAIMQQLKLLKPPIA